MLGEKSMWENDPYAGVPIVIENTTQIKSWKKHAEKLQNTLNQIIDQRNEAKLESERSYDQRDAWKETCREIQKTYAPQLAKEQVLAIYDRKKTEIEKEELAKLLEKYKAFTSIKPNQITPANLAWAQDWLERNREEYGRGPTFLRIEELMKKFTYPEVNVCDLDRIEVLKQKVLVSLNHIGLKDVKSFELDDMNFLNFLNNTIDETTKNVLARESIENLITEKEAFSKKIYEKKSKLSPVLESLGFEDVAPSGLTEKDLLVAEDWVKKNWPGNEKNPKLQQAKRLLDELLSLLGHQDLSSVE